MTETLVAVSPPPNGSEQEPRQPSAAELEAARELVRPTEAINGRLEHLRGSALGFRNLANYMPGRCSRPALQTPTATPSIGMSQLA